MDTWKQQIIMIFNALWTPKKSIIPWASAQYQDSACVCLSKAKGSPIDSAANLHQIDTTLQHDA